MTPSSGFEAGAHWLEAGARSPLLHPFSPKLIIVTVRHTNGVSLVVIRMSSCCDLFLKESWRQRISNSLGLKAIYKLKIINWIRMISDNLIGLWVLSSGDPILWPREHAVKRDVLVYQKTVYLQWDMAAILVYHIKATRLSFGKTIPVS